MKKITLILTSLLILGAIFFYSCKKEKEKEYSCNPKVNKWVKNQLKSLENISYDTLISYPLEYQKGVFEAASPEQRYGFWIEKFKRILALKWTSPENDYILKLQNTMQVDWFKDGIDSAKFSEIDKFLKDWVSEGFKNQQMSLEMLHAIAGRIDYEVDSIHDRLLATNFSKYGGGVYSGGSTSVTSITKDCTCSSESDWCPSILECKGDICEETSHGCGTIWIYKCTGNCK